MMIYIFVILVLLVILGTIIVLICNRIIKFNTIVIESDKIEKDMNIVFISDLHVGRDNKKNALNKLINMINEVDGDILLIGGDMVGRKPLKYYKDDELKDIIGNLKIKNRFFVGGNHDDYNLSLYDNFKILNDESVSLGNNVVLTGLKWKKGESLDDRLARKDFNILLSHYPDRVVEYSKIDLALGGHSHGNQINLPFCKFHHKEKYTRGLYNVGENTKLYVNRGLGFSFLKIRVFSYREIVKIELRKC